MIESETAKNDIDPHHYSGAKIPFINSAPQAPVDRLILRENSKSPGFSETTAYPNERLPGTLPESVPKIKGFYGRSRQRMKPALKCHQVIWLMKFGIP